MTRRDPTTENPDISVDELRTRYSAIRTKLGTIPPEDICHHLPNLIETIADTSAEEENTVRFLVGVSFTHEHLPLDYRLDRVYETMRMNRRIETVKTPVSEDHFYLRFAYPPDPHFDAGALRGTLLEAVDREHRSLATEDEEPESYFSNLWGQLAGQEL